MSNKSEASPPREASRPAILLRLLTFMIVLAAILFAAAGRWNWLRGWLYMAMYAALAVVSVFLVPLDPELIAERTQMKEGVKEWDKRLSTASGLLYPLAILVVAGLDERLGWLPGVAPAVSWVALVIAAAGDLLSIRAAAVNKFYGRFVRIQRERGHHVIDGGPYATIRHPGYLGQIIFSLASALALGSLWALIPSGLFSALLVVRTALEDRTLREELEGYQEYARRVRFRLMPYVW